MRSRSEDFPCDYYLSKLSFIKPCKFSYKLPLAYLLWTLESLIWSSNPSSAPRSYERSVRVGSLSEGTAFSFLPGLLSLRS